MLIIDFDKPKAEKTEMEIYSILTDEGMKVAIDLNGKRILNIHVDHLPDIIGHLQLYNNAYPAT